MSDHSEANRRWENQVNNFDSPILTDNYLALIAKRFSSSGIFPRTHSLEILQKILNLRRLQMESSSCRCSMTSIGRREEIQNNEFQIPNKSRITRRDSRKGTGHSLQEQRHLTLHCGCFDYRSLISNDSFSKSGQYVQSSLWRVQSKAYRKRERESRPRKFRGKREWAATEKCETARSANSKEWWSSIWKQIARMSSEFRNIEEKTSNLQNKVHMIQILGTHVLEIQIPCMTTPNRTSWVVICRGRNRYVDELHVRDPGHNPTSTEFLLGRSIAKESEPC